MHHPPERSWIGNRLKKDMLLKDDDDDDDDDDVCQTKMLKGTHYSSSHELVLLE